VIDAGGDGGGGVAGGGDGDGDGAGGDGDGGEVTVGTVTVGGAGAGEMMTVTVVIGTWPSAPRASTRAEPKPAATSINPAAIQAARRPPFRAARMQLL
jgi:hypothetical protein